MVPLPSSSMRRFATTSERSTLPSVNDFRPDSADGTAAASGRVPGCNHNGDGSSRDRVWHQIWINSSIGSAASGAKLSVEPARGRVAELADAPDSKSGEVHSSCGFDPHLGHQENQGFQAKSPPFPAGLIFETKPIPKPIFQDEANLDRLALQVCI